MHERNAHSGVFFFWVHTGARVATVWVTMVTQRREREKKSTHQIVIIIIILYVLCVCDAMRIKLGIHDRDHGRNKVIWR